MTEAILPAALSGPLEERMLCRTASAPLPEMGRISMSGSVSGGMPAMPMTGAASSPSASTAPEALSAETHSVSAVRAGMIPTAVRRPSRAPFRNASKIFTPFRRPKTTIPVIVKMTI